MLMPIVPSRIPAKILQPNMRTAATMSPEGAHIGDSYFLMTESLSDNCPAPAHMQAIIRLVANHLGDPHRSSLMFQATIGQKRTSTPWNVEISNTIKMVFVCIRESRNPSC